jgi:histone H3/H4
MAISSTALAVMDSFFVDIFQRIAREASDLCLRANRKTLKVEDLRAATRLVLNGDIAKFAVEEGKEDSN